MVASRSLLQGLLVEALRFGFAVWGQDSTAEFKGPRRDAHWHQDQTQVFWEAEARNCTERLRSLAACGVEVEIYRAQLKSIPRCSVQEAFLLGVLSGVSAVLGGIGLFLVCFFWRRSRLDPIIETGWGPLRAPWRHDTSGSGWPRAGCR